MPRLPFLALVFSDHKVSGTEEMPKSIDVQIEE